MEVTRQTTKIMKEETKRTCHLCKYRGSVPGSTHSSCKFDWVASKHFPPQGTEHGIKNLWWQFPFNYDPKWMMGECKEFNDGRNDVNKVPAHLDKKPMPPDGCFPREKATPEDIINRFIREENVKFDQERDDWIIEAMIEYSKSQNTDLIKEIDPGPIISDFDLRTVYVIDDEVKHGGNEWVFKPTDEDCSSSIWGIYPGTGNGWKIKKP